MPWVLLKSYCNKIKGNSLLGRCSRSRTQVAHVNVKYVIGEKDLPKNCWFILTCRCLLGVKDSPKWNPYLTAFISWAQFGNQCDCCRPEVCDVSLLLICSVIPPVFVGACRGVLPVKCNPELPSWRAIVCSWDSIHCFGSWCFDSAVPVKYFLQKVSCDTQMGSGST